MPTMPQKELVLAAATGSTGGLGKIGVVPATTGTLLVRCPNQGPAGRTSTIDWRVKSDQAYGYTFFRSHDLPTATITMAEATRVDDADTFILNGLTYTAETTATDAAYASRKWKANGADADADVVALTALLNADWAVVPDGSVAVSDTLVIATTDELTSDTTTYTYTAAASPVYASRIFDQSGNQAAELASLVLALNHRRNVTLATCTAGTTIRVAGQYGKTYTFTAHATTTTVASREFSIAGTNSQDADELVTCINDATYGVPGYTATNVSGAVHIARNSASVPEPVITSSNSTTAACVNTAGGVPGVVAAATGATGELSLTPTWVKSISATGGTHITCTECDNPGLLATSSAHVITITPGTPGNPYGGKQAYVMQFGQGTSDAAEIAFALGTTSFAQDGAAVTGRSANSTTSAGELYEHDVHGWAHGYLLYANGAGSDATVTIAATKY